MILFTVGTTSFPFNRMALLANRIASLRPKEKIIFQHGATPVSSRNKNLDLYKYLSFDELQKYIKQARLIFCHAGPATIYQIINHQKKPIVIPRSEQYAEHVNDHQVHFYNELVRHNSIFTLKKYARNTASNITLTTIKDRTNLIKALTNITANL